MKVAVHVFFNNPKFGQESFPHFIEWNYPVLPRVGEHICGVTRFLSESMLDLFKNSMIKDFCGENHPFWEKTLYELYSDSNGDYFYIDSVEWLYHPEYGDYPLINIMEQTV